MKQADFPNQHSLQPMPSGVVPNISNNINSQNSNVGVQGESSADTVSTVNPPMQGQQQPVVSQQHGMVYYALVLGALIIFTGVLCWLVLRRKEK
jgi:hypothetical protein